LNILDADYYFRLLDAMQQQDLPEALLIYDDINRKGFEGDLVLNGLAEFIRNLLVCKDEKAASLLEAVESFRDRYIGMGKKVDAGWLVSALHVLNDAEINYKPARNKRLHVELALIKLCYLAQAMQVVAGTSAEKKRQSEPLKPVSFRNIPTMEPAPVRERKKRQEDKPEKNAVQQDPTVQQQSPPVQQEGAKLVIDTEVMEKPMVPGTVAGSLGTLSRIRRQFADQTQNKDSETGQALDIESLHRAWHQYADSLRENRNPAAPSLEMATLRIVDTGSFEVVVTNNLQQRFIEQEKRGLSDHLQQVLANRAISFVVLVEEGVSAETPAERPLNKREQFMQIVDQYPLVKELKDRLRLELDY
jgi:DNA polymerase-3 subunit gamma/tau